MHKSRKWARILAAGVALLLVAAFAASCGPREETPAPAVTIVVTETVVVETVPFAPGQVIISGPMDQVGAAVDELGGRLETRLQRLILQEADINPSECDTITDQLEILGECVESGELWVLDLYQLAAPEPEAVVEAVWAISREEFPCVFLHPNYLLGDPWTGVGSPWTGVGSPWTGVGSPVPGTGATSALQSDFRGQWAFEDIGLYDEDEVRQVDPTGAGVRIGVFDTSPYELEEEPGPALEVVDWVTKPFTLTVWHPEFLAPLPAPTDTPQVSLTLANHGLFVAGLAHEVALDSEIHLYRVLDEYLQGDLFTLDAAIYHFITETRAVGGESQRAVINLSLGIHPQVGREDLDLPPRGDGAGVAVGWRPVPRDGSGRSGRQRPRLWGSGATPAHTRAVRVRAGGGCQ